MGTGKIQKYVPMTSKTLQREILEIIPACHTIKYLALMALSSGILKVSIKNNLGRSLGVYECRKARIG